MHLEAHSKNVVYDHEWTHPLKTVQPDKVRQQGNNSQSEFFKMI